MSGRSRSSSPPLERAKFWIDPHLDGLELLTATYVTHAFSRHVHEEFAIGVIEDGTECFYHRGANHVAPAGSIIVVNPGEVHTGHAARETGWTYRMLYPGGGVLRRAAAEISGRTAGTPFFKEAVLQDRGLFTLLRRAHVSMEHSPSRLERESHMLLALTQLISRHAEKRPSEQYTGREPRAVRRAKHHLEDYYAENISLEHLSRIAGLSRFHLVRTFREETGLPPHAYLLGVRLRKAKSLLLEGVPVARTALDTGFFDQSHLTRHFKRLVGVPPGQYARGAGLRIQQ